MAEAQTAHPSNGLLRMLRENGVSLVAIVGVISTSAVLHHRVGANETAIQGIRAAQTEERRVLDERMRHADEKARERHEAIIQRLSRVEALIRDR